MITFVTGATGFLGRHLIEQLADRQKKIRILTRRYEPDFEAYEVEQIIGSMDDQEIIASSLDDVNEIYHLAGRVERDPDLAKDLYHLHVNGTVTLFDAVRKVCDSGAEPPKIVVASTSGTVAVSKDSDFIGNDHSPYADEVVGHWPYYLSKIYQERVIDRYITHFKLPIVTMRPTIIYGPGDYRGSSCEDIVSFLNDEVRVVPKGGISFVDVRDVAEAFIRAMDRAKPGSKYLLAAANMTLHSFFQELASITEKPEPIKMDDRVIKTGASLVRRLQKIFNKETSTYNPVNVDMATHFWYVDASRAKKELGWYPRSVEQTLLDTVKWLEENHPDLKPKSGRRSPPKKYVPRETVEYAEKIRRPDVNNPEE